MDEAFEAVAKDAFGTELILPPKVKQIGKIIDPFEPIIPDPWDSQEIEGFEVAEDLFENHRDEIMSRGLNEDRTDLEERLKEFKSRVCGRDYYQSN